MEGTATSSPGLKVADDVDVPGDEPAGTVTQEPLIEGYGASVTLKVGGHKPTDSKVVLRGGRIAVEGQFDKEDRISLLVTARVVDLQFPDKIDSKTGDVVQTTRVHVLRNEGVRRLSDAEVKRISGD